MYSLKSAQQHITMALGPHLQNSLDMQQIPNKFSPPVYFGPLPTTKSQNTSRTILIQGTLEKFRRNYGCIAELMNRFGSQSGVPFFNFHIVGDGSSAKSLLAWIASQIQNKDHLGRIKCTMNASYQEFFDILRSSSVDWIMPCVDETFEHSYFTSKITSSVMMAVGHAIPLILHKKLSSIYGFCEDGECLIYDNTNLHQMFLKALTLNSETQYNMRNSMRQFRLKWLNHLETVF
jgi:hypothetical protein